LGHTVAMQHTMVNECYRSEVMRVTVHPPRPGTRPGAHVTMKAVTTSNSDHNNSGSALSEDDDISESCNQETQSQQRSQSPSPLLHSDSEDTIRGTPLSQAMYQTCRLNKSIVQDLRRNRPLPSSLQSLSWISAVDLEYATPGSKRNAHCLNESEVSVYEFLVRHRIPTAVANQLLAMLQDDRFDVLDLRFRSLETYHMQVFMEAKYGIRRVDLHVPMDGDQEVVFWHRSLWDIVTSILGDPGMCASIQYDFQPDSAGEERIYSTFMGGKWMETASTLIRDQYPDCTVIPVIMGSDGTRIKSRLGAHPIYITLGNLSLKFRQGKNGWNLAGCVPDRIRSLAPKQSDLLYTRRTRQILNMCVVNALADIKDIFKEGGRVLKCGDGRTRRIILMWALCITDRLEHESLCLVPAHTCFHCTMPKHLWPASTQRAWTQSSPRMQQDVRHAAMTAAETGVYGENEEWRIKIQKQAPILGLDANGRIIIVSEERYRHCAQVLGVFPEPNLLWTLPHAEVYLLCRDDPMHMMDLGVLQKLQEAMMAKYLR